MADYSPHRPRPSGRGWDAGCSTRQGPRKCRTSTSRAQEARLVSHLSGGEGADETGCWTPGRHPHRIPSFGKTEALAQSLAGELLAIKGTALRELLRPGKGHCHRLETCIAHQLRGDLDRALVVARNGYSHRIACTVRFLHEVGIAHRVECTHHVRALRYDSVVAPMPFSFVSFNRSSPSRRVTALAGSITILPANLGP